MLVDPHQELEWVIEAIRGKPLPEKIENMVFTGGAALVIMLMFFAIFNDISRFF
jgi:regulator of sigma E protease